MYITSRYRCHLSAWAPRRREYYTGVLDCVQKICRDEGPRGQLAVVPMVPTGHASDTTDRSSICICIDTTYVYCICIIISMYIYIYVYIYIYTCIYIHAVL